MAGDDHGTTGAQSRSPAGPGDGPAVAVIIPARNAQTTIADQLGALADQRDAPPFDVTVVDDGSTDDTIELVDHWQHKVPLRLVRSVRNAGPAAARNTGARSAGDRDILLFCDADDVVGPTWIRAMTDGLQSFDLVTGPLDTARLNPPELARRRSSRPTDSLNTVEEFLPFAPTGNLGVRRTVWEALGGLNEDYRQAEDVEFSWRAQLAGYSLGFVPDAVVHYRYRPSLRATFELGRRTGRANAQLYAQFHDAGLRGRPLPTSVRDWLWLIARVPLLASRGERGIWLRRSGEAVGRLRGSAEFGVRYL